MHIKMSYQTNTTPTITPTTMKTMVETLSCFSDQELIGGHSEHKGGGFVPPAIDISSILRHNMQANLNDSTPSSYTDLSYSHPLKREQDIKPIDLISSTFIKEEQIDDVPMEENDQSMDYDDDDDDDSNTGMSNESATNDSHDVQPKKKKPAPKTRSTKGNNKKSSSSSASSSTSSTRKSSKKPISEEDDDRKKVRRERNKQAAARCREKRLLQVKTLTEETHLLEAEKQRMEDTIRSLNQELARLRQQVTGHVCKCQKGSANIKEGTIKGIAHSPSGPSSGKLARPTSLCLESSGRSTPLRRGNKNPSLSTIQNQNPNIPMSNGPAVPVIDNAMENSLIQIETPSYGIRITDGMDDHPLNGLTPSASNFTPMHTNYVLNLIGCSGQQRGSGVDIGIQSPDGGPHKLVPL